MTGEVTMTKPVRTEDTEDGRYDLVVRATDQGRDTQLYSDIRVVIEVRKKWSNEFLDISKLVFLGWQHSQHEAQVFSAQL